MAACAYVSRSWGVFYRTRAKRMGRVVAVLFAYVSHFLTLAVTVHPKYTHTHTYIQQQQQHPASQRQSFSMQSHDFDKGLQFNIARLATHTRICRLSLLVGEHFSHLILSKVHDQEVL